VYCREIQLDGVRAREPIAVDHRRAETVDRGALRRVAAIVERGEWVLREGPVECEIIGVRVGAEPFAGRRKDRTAADDSDGAGGFVVRRIPVVWVDRVCRHLDPVAPNWRQ